MARLHAWRPAMRMAWRDLLAHRMRTVVVTVLVALPVTIAVLASTLAATNDYQSPNSLYERYGTADAELQVSPFSRVRTRYYSGLDVGTVPVRGAEDRKPSSVDLATLLPDGSRFTLVGTKRLLLASGGTLDARVVDLAESLTRGLAQIESGRPPQAADEVALTPLVADAFGLLDDGRLVEDAVLPLEPGGLRVVGLLEESDYYASSALVAPTSPGSDRVVGDDSLPYLVDLPELDTEQLQALRRDLDRAGVGSWMRDAVEHPDAWRLPAPAATPVDPVALAVGALVIGLGLTEVLVLVGAAFAVGARRQGRTLGLLIASGGTAADVRRTVLAQGLWIGVVAAALGTAGGLAALGLARDQLGQLTGTTYYEYSLSVGTVVVIALLGVVSAVTAAAIPAWGVGRLTASQALDGHLAGGPAATRHRFLRPGLTLVAGGLLSLVASGWWISVVYRATATDEGAVSAVPVVLGGLSALIVLVGTSLVLPSLVTAAGRVGHRGWLPWRLATRDASRHRGRTTAAVLAIGIVTTGAVFAGFGVTAQASIVAASTESPAPPGAAEVYLDERQLRDPDILHSVATTAGEVAGFERLVTWRYATLGGRPLLDRRDGQVRVVDDTFLRAAGVPGDARGLFAEGTALAANTTADGGSIVLRAGPGRSGKRLRIPVSPVSVDWAPQGSVWVSADAAARLGLDSKPAELAWLTRSSAVEPADLERLRLHGIDAFVDGNHPEDPAKLVLAGAGGVLLLTCLVVGMVVALAASEGRDDAATLAAVGAPPRARRATSAGHALFVGGLGAGVGVLLGTAGGATLLQVVGTPGTPVPWAALGVLVAGVPLLCALVGWLVTPTRLSLTRRTG